MRIKMDLKMKLKMATLNNPIDALSKAVKVPLLGTGANQPKKTPIAPTTTTGTTRAQGKTPGNKPPQTYVSLAASPACPSAVLKLMTQWTDLGPPSAELCKNINIHLKEKPAHSQMHISAVKWTVHGNLVITAGLNTLEHHLKAALPDIANLLRLILHLPNKESY
jgi:hypothetical protein